jgi:hypothetical protein
MGMTAGDRVLQVQQRAQINITPDDRCVAGADQHLFMVMARLTPTASGSLEASGSHGGNIPSRSNDVI